MFPLSQLKESKSRASFIAIAFYIVFSTLLHLSFCSGGVSGDVDDHKVHPLLNLSDSNSTSNSERILSPRDDLDRAVFVADYPLVQVLVDIYKSGELVSGIPPVVLDRKDERGRTALMKCGFDPQSENKTLVDITCMYITKLLHETGADIYSSDNFGWTPLHYAASMGYVEVSKYLVKEAEKEEKRERDDYHKYDDKEKKSSGSLTKEKQKKETVISLDPEYKYNAAKYIDHTDEKGLTALTKAVTNGHYKVVDHLLLAGADINKADERGWSPLFFAARNCFHEAWPPILDLLLEDEDERKRKRVNANMNLRQSKTIDLNIQDYLDRSPLMYAANVGSSKCVSSLLKKGASLDLVDKGGNSALSLASNDDVRDAILLYMKTQVSLWRQQKQQKFSDDNDNHLLEKSATLEINFGKKDSSSEKRDKNSIKECEIEDIDDFIDDEEKRNLQERMIVNMNNTNISQLEALKAATLTLQESI